jgi:hypothetical protein
MKFVQRLLMGIGGLAAAAALLAVLAPKAAHAVTATLVEVVNTRSTPVPNQDVDAPGRHPYSQTCSSTGSGNFFGCDMPTVPPNTEVVIQNVSMLLSGGSPTSGSLVSTSGGQVVTAYIPLVAVGGPYFSASQPITQYIDPGTVAACYGPFGFTGFSCTISGYTVSLP